MSSRPPLSFGFNLLTACVLGVGGWYVGWFGAHAVVRRRASSYLRRHRLQRALGLLAYLGGVVGFLVGLGFLNYPFARLRGYPPSLREKETDGIGRYFGLCTDHKVVGIQYLVGIGLFFFIGGLNAMLIRTELLRPDASGLPGRHVPDARRPARHDDDGDDVRAGSSARSRTTSSRS